KTAHRPIRERTEPLEPPKRLNRLERTLWDRHSEPSRWLEQLDTALAYDWVSLAARMLREGLSTALTAQWRLISGDLGLRPADRQAMAQPEPPKGERFF